MIYLDNAATTAVCPAAAQKAAYMMTVCFGNPSSLHTAGTAAAREVEAARRAVAALLGAPADRVIFTSGGTESNALAILGGAAANCRIGRHAVTTAVEHASVTKCFDELEKQGWQVTRLIPDGTGMISPQAVAEACRPDTALVSVMTVNNETGARFAVEEMVSPVRAAAPKALFHTDAVQAAGKIPVNVKKWGVDLLSVSGHKLHAPKGVGALYVRDGVRLLPRSPGGGQEQGLRSGTQATPAIAGFGAAAAETGDLAALNARFEELYRLLEEGLAAIPGVRLHQPASRVPYILNISLPGLRSETMVHFLAQRDIYLSGGSACARGKQSPVLKAMGLPPEEIDSSLRISFCRDTGPEDIRNLLAALQEADKTLIRTAAFRRLRQL